MMQRIRAVLDKLNGLAQRKSDRSVIDIDLMLDYTRMVYADLLDLRATMSAKTTAVNEPTLDELTAAAVTQQETPASPYSPTLPPSPVASVHQSAKDIRQFIDLNEKYLLLSELFRNNVSAYEDAMKTINALKTENEAMQWMNSQQWPANEDTMKAFKDLIKRFYH